MGRIFYINGRFVKEEKASISVLDLGFVRGYGVFDFLRTYNSQPFYLEEHLQRLKKSAGEIDLEIPLTFSQIKNIILTLLKKNKLPEANIKIIVTGGISSNQITPSGKNSFAVLVTKLTNYPPQYYLQGASAITFKKDRFLPTSKTLNYITGIMGLNRARKNKSVEALFTSQKNEIREGTTTNFFAVKNHRLITAKDDILWGITRKVVLDLAARKMAVEFRPLKVSELSEIQEAFITSSTKEIMPIIKIDDKIIGDGKVGKHTSELMADFKKLTGKWT